jgi:RNA polymerase sigma factor (sigma-70 family)
VNDLLAIDDPKNSLRHVSLGQLCNLALGDRCESLLRHGQESFESALRTLDSVGVATRMDAHRLAWAVAFNVDGLPLSGAIDEGSRRSGSGYRDRWPLDTAWPVLWSVLVRPLPQDDSSYPSTLLSELALSVACEQREDWQHPSTRPIDSAVANQIFEFVYAENKLKVLGVCRRFAVRGGEPEAIAHEAWSRVFCDYWSAHAPRRFLGLSRISTLVCQVARYIAIDSIRSQAPFVINDEDLSDDKSSPSVEGLSEIFDPLANLAAEQLYSRVKKCMSQLPAKRQVVADMVWLRQMNARRVAQILRVSEPAISQHLNKARNLVAICLREHGFSPLQ